jgi:hypothetical protein
MASAIYGLKGELLKLFSHLTSTRCGPHVWRGRCQIDSPALPTLVPVVDRLPGWRILSITCPKMWLHTWHWRCLGEFQYAESFLKCAFRHFEHNSPWQTELLLAHLVGDSDQNFESFRFHPYTGYGFSVSSFCKINFWKCILLFE